MKTLLSLFLVLSFINGYSKDLSLKAFEGKYQLLGCDANNTIFDFEGNDFDLKKYKNSNFSDEREIVLDEVGNLILKANYSVMDVETQEENNAELILLSFDHINGQDEIIHTNIGPAQIKTKTKTYVDGNSVVRKQFDLVKILLVPSYIERSTETMTLNGDKLTIKKSNHVAYKCEYLKL